MTETEDLNPPQSGQIVHYRPDVRGPTACGRTETTPWSTTIEADVNCPDCKSAIAAIATGEDTTP